jgi:cytochrome b561
LTGWWTSDTWRFPFWLYWSVPVPDLFDANRYMSEFAAQCHEVMTTLLLVLVLVHIVAAMRHHFVLRNDTLRRMLPFFAQRGD